MKLLITVPWDEGQLLSVKRAFPEVEFVTALSEEQILQAVTDAEIVFGDLSRRAFLAAGKLRWIQCHGAGVNKLMTIPELIAGDVVVTNTSGAHAATIAEHFFGSLIALTRKLPQLYQAQQRGEWVHWSQWSQQVGGPPLTLSGLTLGVIGFGNIGRAIAERAAAFHMNITAIDLLAVPCPPYLAELWGLERLPHLLSQADVVVVTLPGTPQTENLLNREALALLKPGAYLAVVSRGGIVDEEALAEMLTQGRLAGAVLDVFKTEPLPAHSPLWKAPNLILTPHCSGKSEYTTAAATAIWKENLERYRAGSPLRNVIRKELGF